MSSLDYYLLISGDYSWQHDDQKPITRFTDASKDVAEIAARVHVWNWH